MPLHLSNELQSMRESNKSSSAILRCLIDGLIPDIEVFANSNAKILLQNHPIIEKACQAQAHKKK